VLAARTLGAPAFCGLHLHFPGGAERRLVRWCFSRPEVKGVLFCSGTVAEPFEEFVGGKAFVAPYWVSPLFLEAPKGRRTFRERFGVPHDAVLAGVVGRISPTKGQRFFLQSAAPLLRSHPALHLAVVGSADFESREEEDALRAERGASSDPGRIHLALEMTDALEFMDSLDILVVPSLWEEPFGLVAVEGMARGLPVVVTRSGGLAETVLDGETGFVVAKEAGPLRDALARLVSDPALRRRMGEAGKRRAEERHNPRTCMAALRERALGAADLLAGEHG
jgi:glycosyltransferase involved in cell wall biosynthesis